MAASSRPSSPEVADYLGVLRRRWVIVVVLTVAGAILGVAYARLAPAQYTSAVQIEVSPIPDSSNAAGGRTSSDVDMDNEAQIASSRLVAARAARLMNTSERPVDLVKQIQITVPANTTFLDIQCTQSGRHEATVCANAFGHAYLQNRLATAEGGVSGSLQTQNKRQAQLTSRVAAIRGRLNHVARNSAAHVRAELTLSAVQGELQEVSADVTKLSPVLASLQEPNAVGQITTPGTVPESPSSPRLLLVGPSGVLAGLLIGLLLAFFLDFRDRRIHSSRDVERFLDLPVLVSLAEGRSRMKPALVSPRSRAGQAFTELGQYIAASLGEGSHVVFVAGTSAGPGCSVLAVNLAATLARTRSDVVLVCADAHATISPQLLGVSDGRGLSEVLAGSASASEVLRRPADERRLRVITPGLDSSGVLPNIQYEASRRLLAELRRDSRYVVVEVQSVGEDSSAFALAEFADAAVMTMETSLTTRSAAAECLQRLDRLRTSVLGAVVLPAAGKGTIRRSEPPGPGSGRDAARPLAERPEPDRPAEADRLAPIPSRPAPGDRRLATPPRTDTARADQARAGGRRSEPARPRAGRPEPARPEAMRPEAARPEAGRTDAPARSSARASRTAASERRPSLDDLLATSDRVAPGDSQRTDQRSPDQRAADRRALDDLVARSRTTPEGEADTGPGNGTEVTGSTSPVNGRSPSSAAPPPAPEPASAAPPARGTTAPSPSGHGLNETRELPAVSDSGSSDEELGKLPDPTDKISRS